MHSLRFDIIPESCIVCNFFFSSDISPIFFFYKSSFASKSIANCASIYPKGSMVFFFYKYIGSHHFFLNSTFVVSMIIINVFLNGISWSFHV